MKTVLVTGAAKGIGLATAKLFQDKGWKVLSLDKQFGSEVVGEKVIFDLRDFFSIPKLIRNLDPIDTLVNNAAVLYCDELGKIPIDHIEEILSVNLRAPVALMDAVIPGMQGRKHGRVVSVGSVSAFTGHPDLWYGATKAALLNITKSYAGQFGSDGIIVNAVAPGLRERICMISYPNRENSQSCKAYIFRGHVSHRKWRKRYSGWGRTVQSTYLEPLLT